MEDAAHSLRLALEREEAARAHQEAAARDDRVELPSAAFLSRLQPRAAHAADRHQGLTRPA